MFLISDFLTGEAGDPDLERAARKLAWDHDLVPIRLSDPGSAELPNVGMLAVTDPEGGVRRVVNTSDRRVREAFRAESAATRDGIDVLFRALSLDVVEISTVEEYLPPIISFFRQRARASR